MDVIAMSNRLAKLYLLVTDSSAIISAAIGIGGLPYVVQRHLHCQYHWRSACVPRGGIEHPLSMQRRPGLPLIGDALCVLKGRP